MRNTPQFAFDVVACAALGIMLWAACAGIGYRILPRPRPPRAGPDDEHTDERADDAVPASWRQPGVAACVGLGLLVTVGGVAVVLRIPWWLLVVPFLVIGLVLAMQELRGLDFHYAAATRSALVIGVLGVVAFGLVALTQAPVGLRFPLNICDDLRAYLPMTHRLLDTSGLDEAWSTRRLQGLGGFTFLQALPVAVFGNAGIGVAETLIASVFLAGLFVANGFRSTWARALSVGLILAVPLLWVPRANTTGVLLGSPLLVAVFAATAELRGALRAGDRPAAIRWAVGGGVVIAALISIRPNLGLGALVLAIGALSVTGTRIVTRVQVTVAGAASTLLAVAPWSVASWMTVGTPLYPLFPGNLNRAALQHSPPRGIAAVANQAIDLASTGPYLWITLGVLLVALAARRVLPDPMLVVIAAAVTEAVTIAFAFETSSVVPVSAFARYTAPMSGGLAIFFVCEAIRGVDARHPREPARARQWAVPVLVVAAALGLATLGYIDLGFRNEFSRVGGGQDVFRPAGVRVTPLPAGAELVRLAATNQLQPKPGREVTTSALRDDYARAMRLVDPERTIVAVDRPYLIDYSRYDVPNLDAPGVVAPGGEFPVFRGPGAKIARLRRAGFDTLVATDPVADACMSPRRINEILLENKFARSRYRSALDWVDDIAAITQRAPRAVRRVGSLLVIDLPRAQRELPAAAKGA